MKESQKILLGLLKYVIQPDTRIDIPQNINWHEVYEEAEKQNLVAFSWKAVEKLRQRDKFDADKN